jgi:hypothetical protein
MMKFEDLHVTEQLELALTIIGWFGVHKCPTINRLAVARDQSVTELWVDVCAEVGIDLCEPWHDYPAAPTRETFANSRGANQPLPPEWEKRNESIQRLASRFRRGKAELIGASGEAHEAPTCLSVRVQSVITGTQNIPGA